MAEARSEWVRLQRLFRDALPECPDILADLGRAATERIPVRKIPHQQVPLIVSALYLLKEYWREVLFLEAIDDATGIIAQAGREPGPRQEGRGSPTVRSFYPSEYREYLARKLREKGMELIGRLRRQAVCSRIMA